MNRWSPIKPADGDGTKSAVAGEAVPPPLSLTLESFRPLLRPALLFASYATWILLFRLIALSCVTYFMARGQSPAPSFGEIDEAFASNELTLLGLASVGYVLLLWAFYPILGTTRDEIFSRKRFRAFFMPGFAHGATLSLGVILVFVVTGQYRYFGVPIQADESVLAILAILIRTVTLAALAFCEELLFRQKIWRRLRMVFPQSWSVAMTAAAYCLLKLMQFELGVMNLITLFLLSIALSMRQLADGDFMRGAGFWAGILVIMQPVMGLPVFGTEFSGLLLFKHAEPTATVRLLSGGRGGPLPSIVFQFLLLLDILRSHRRERA